MGHVADVAFLNLIHQIEGSLPQVKPFLPVIIILGSTFLGWLFELIVLGRMARLAKHTAWKGDDIIVNALQKRFIFWGFLLGIFLTLLPFSSDQVVTVIDNILLVFFVISLTAVIARIGAGLIMISTGSADHPAISLVPTVVRVVIYILGFLIILQVFHVSITPALAALGVGGLAVSLALQATLTDLVSGIQIIAAHQVHPGDYISLGDGENGYVQDINWRTTTVRQLSNNLVIIPNSKMTSSILVNYHEPDTALSILVNLGVSYNSDLEHVERVTVDVAKEIMQSVPGGVPDNDPFIRYGAFGDSSINFTVILRGKEFTDQYLIKHEFIKRLHKRYHEEGIEIPFPSRTVHIKEGGLAAPLAMPGALPAGADVRE